MSDQDQMILSFFLVTFELLGRLGLRWFSNCNWKRPDSRLELEICRRGYHVRAVRVSVWCLVLVSVPRNALGSCSHKIQVTTWIEFW